MNIFKKFILIIGSIIIQCTFLNWLEIQNAKPDFLLVIVICVSLCCGIEEGIVFGFFAGLAEDILCGGILGMNAFIKTLIGFIIGMFNKNLYNINFAAQGLISFIATLLQGSIVYIFLKIFQFNVSWNGNFLYIVFLSATYNIILIVLVFPKINKWIRYRSTIF